MRQTIESHAGSAEETFVGPMLDVLCDVLCDWLVYRGAYLGVLAVISALLLAALIAGAALSTSEEQAILPKPIGGQTIESGCDPNGWCWKPCTVPEGWRIVTVDDVSAVQKDSYALAILPARIIVMPKSLTPEAVKAGWTMDILQAHEKAHACWQMHEGGEL